MQPILSLVERPLTLRQPHLFKCEYELRYEDQVIATLQFRSGSGTFATGSCSEGQWTFKRVGFFKTRITICEKSSGTEIAVFYNNTWKSGGTLVMHEGDKVLLTSNTWQTRLTFKTESEERILDLITKGFIKQTITFELSKNAAERSKFPMFILFGWYMTVMQNNESSSNDAAAIAVALAM